MTEKKDILFKCYVWLTVYLDMTVQRNTNLMHNLSVYISSTSTRFGCIYAHHQEVQPYVYNWYVLSFFLDDCLLSWVD